MTHGDGHARVPTTRFPLTASPNLQSTSTAHSSVPWPSPSRPRPESVGVVLLVQGQLPAAGWPPWDTASEGRAGMGRAGPGQERRRALPWLLPVGHEPGSGGSGGWGPSQLLACGWGGKPRGMWDGAFPSPLPGGAQLRLRAAWIQFVLVLATQKCHPPRAASWAALHTRASWRGQRCLLTNKCAARSPGREGPAAGEQQTTGEEAHESSQSLLQALHPQEPAPTRHTALVPPLCVHCPRQSHNATVPVPVVPVVAP